jgi:hypothetical protein
VPITKEMAMSAGELCMALTRADTEDEVIALLRAAGYWDNPDVWRDLGDDDNNFATIGNQQSEAIAALIEKVINSVDARLMNACLTAGIEATSPAAPQSIREAVALFFEGKKLSSLGEKDGRVAYWTDSNATSEGRLLTVTATGNTPEQGWPCLTIADQGEGQTPDDFPDTFMSLHRANKLRIPFVQGKFNMGGTGVFQFCDTRHRVQLAVSRRNPALLASGATGRDHEWGFTVVRRQAPADGRRSSVFTYLAPIDATTDRRGAVLSFPAETWPIFPESDAKVRDAYAREAPHGSMVKLYEYKWQGTKSNIIQSRDGLLRRLDQGLPELALPVRVFECRPGYKGGPGSFATNVLGLSARLERDRADKLETGFPRGSVIDIEGKKVRAKVLAFKKDVAPEYRTARNGVILSINGQAHASLPIDFFRRQSVGMSYLADSLLVTVDCTGIEGEAREDLFMNSRDRLRDNAIAARLVDELESLVRDEPALKALRNRRREEDLAEKLSDSKPLATVLEDLVRRSPTLAKLFLQGARLPSPFPPGSGPGTGGAGTENGTGTGGEFKGKTYPTYFRFKGLADGQDLERDAFLGSRVRVQFETDAENGYFVRDLFPGESTVWRMMANDEQTALANTRMDGPRSGIATLNLDLPDDVAAGSVLILDIEVTDDMRIDPFVNRLVLRVHEARQGGGGGGRGRGRRGGDGGGGLNLPEITPVKEEDWAKYSFHTFNEESALVVVNAGADTDGDAAADVFDFYVNVDNKYLRTVQKESPKEDPKLLEAKFTYSLVLVGLALIHDDRAQRRTSGNGDDDSGESETIESLVVRATSALAPVLLPMVETIGGLSLDDE